ncbi:MAG: hypothetical protein IJF25_07880 [Oscillospiraceae bacterium]|nr:hypothetical protein [Oscillospiraceae bacterium]MBQ4539535.1 hypothetical protein [Oscillospiraceae bacterium]
MSRQAIAQIEKAEETARSILLAAQKEAREQLAEAQRISAQKLADAKRRLAELSNAAAEKQRLADEAYTAEQLEKTRLECESIEEKTSANIEKAVIHVMERVMN